MTKKSRLWIIAYLVLLGVVFTRQHILVQAQGVLPKTFIACKQTAVECDFSGDTAIQQAIDAARNGDIVEIRAGSYNTSLTLSPKSIYIQGAGKTNTVINGSVTINGLSTTYIQIEKLTIQQSASSGIMINGSPSILLNQLLIQNHAKSGVESGKASILAIKSSTIQNNGVGVMTTSTSTFTTSNSVYANNTLHAIQRNSPQILLFQATHSIFYNNGGDGIQIDNVELEIETTTITNNIFMSNEGFGIGTSIDPIDLFYTHNLFFQNTQGCSNMLTICNTEGTILDVDPLFENASASNFKPLSGSPLINSGLGEDPDSSVADIGIYGGLFACEFDASPSYCSSGASPNPTNTPLPIQNTQEPNLQSTDANGDSKTTIADFEIWRSEFRSPNSGTRADFNKDGRVTAADFESWRNAFVSK